MCQAFEAEHRLHVWMERESRERGMPITCRKCKGDLSTYWEVEESGKYTWPCWRCKTVNYPSKEVKRLWLQEKAKRKS